MESVLWRLFTDFRIIYGRVKQSDKLCTLCKCSCTNSKHDWQMASWDKTEQSLYVSLFVSEQQTLCNVSVWRNRCCSLCHSHERGTLFSVLIYGHIFKSCLKNVASGLQEKKPLIFLEHDAVFCPLISLPPKLFCSRPVELFISTIHVKHGFTAVQINWWCILCSGCPQNQIF